ncbi:PREDICTED: probable glycosyltransferase At3g07620 [Camelina sativa]|uniref:Probable glycosyltransferase At3g07620 n=2 Tax=Camelina sativa TaxID=90675 RepID=A0ABM0XW74_CAMSA|nr:PREDICTED: probable glycosyltransferase At3g07620 [Camelina sativa]XP_010491898.1 PREDICTED: probable glycosyltransferase At3g07620 [Camelina sativa]XP_010491899.1 PREDICTED: probable glycosyltransferase At3g07620 [Camelina sativa]
MDQIRGLRFLGRAETCSRVVLLMVLVVAFVLGLQYFELAPLSIFSPGNVNVSKFRDSNYNTTKSAENETFLASQEEASSGFKPYNSTTKVSKSFEHKFLNDAPKTEASRQSKGNETTTSSLHSLQPKIPRIRKKHEQRNTKKPPLVVISITQMNNMMWKRHNDPKNSLAPLWGSKVDEELKTARDKIKNAALVKKDDTLYAPLYHNLSTFKRSYELMEQTLKVYVYAEGDRPIFHQPEAMMEGIYASEGWFMKLMESSHRFLTKDPTKAHLFYLPFSSRILQQKLYVHDSHSRRNLVKYLRNYIDLISSNYTFWNRTHGSDHFFTACHDWAPAETRGPYMNCIRSLCNADVGVDFVVGKDVSLPETKVSSSQNPNGKIGGNRPSKRTILAFFAGNLHGYVRPILLNHWSSRPEPDMKIFNRVDHKSYIRYMKRSRYCVCAKGYEVNSPRVVESILYGCVPVIISDNFVPPFLEILNWESFAVFVPEKEIPNLRKILVSIPVRRYVEMQKRVSKVQKHFMWHDGEPVRYDLFHTILHSVWYNRVFQTF